MESTNGDRFIIWNEGKTLPKDWRILDSRFEVSDVPLRDSRKFTVHTWTAERFHLLWLRIHCVGEAAVIKS